MLRLAEWIGALHAFRTDRDYGVFAPLLGQDQMPAGLGDKLRSAAFAQQVQWLDVAEMQLRDVRDWLDADGRGGAGALRGISRHFVPDLKKQFDWIGKKGFERQRDLAIDALENGNLWQATLYGFEAFVTRVNDRPEDYVNPRSPRNDANVKAEGLGRQEGDDPGKLRDKTRRAFEKSWEHLEDGQAASPSQNESQACERFRCYRNLQNLRNAVAHGGMRKIEANALQIETNMTRLISDTRDLEAVLRESFRLLLDYDKPSAAQT